MGFVCGRVAMTPAVDAMGGCCWGLLCCRIAMTLDFAAMEGRWCGLDKENGLFLSLRLLFCVEICRGVKFRVLTSSLLAGSF